MLRWLSHCAMRLLFGIVECFPKAYSRSMARAAALVPAAPPNAVLLVGSLLGLKALRPDSRGVFGPEMASSRGCRLLVGLRMRSKIRLWRSMQEDLAPLPVHNAGFGGARSVDLLRAMEPLVLEGRPSMVVYYCGVNDLHFGARAEAKGPRWKVRAWDERASKAPELKLLRPTKEPTTY